MEVTVTELPQHLSNALDAMGIVLIIKKPDPRQMPQPSGWMPTIKGQEPPF